MPKVGVGEQNFSPGLRKLFDVMSSISSEPFPTMTSSGVIPCSKASLARSSSELSLGYAQSLAKSKVSATSSTAGLTPNKLALSFKSIKSRLCIEYEGLDSRSSVRRLSSPMDVIRPPSSHDSVPPQRDR